MMEYVVVIMILTEHLELIGFLQPGHLANVDSARIVLELILLDEHPGDRMLLSNNCRSEYRSTLVCLNER